MCVVTESWLNPDIPDSGVLLTNFLPPIRNDRSVRRGGGVAVYIKKDVPHKHWHTLRSDDVESVWLTIRPKKLPRHIPNIIVGAIYHPPPPHKDYLTIQHIFKSVETILQQHPSAGIVILGDLNKLKTSSICNSFHLKQIVKLPTRKGAILDKILTNMDQYYQQPEIISHLGKSDHNMVVAIPHSSPTWSPPKCKKTTVVSRAVSDDGKLSFGQDLLKINWSPLYRASTCDLQFQIFTTTLNHLIDQHFPFQTSTAFSNDKPWISNQFKKVIKARQKAKAQNNIEEYKKQRNKVNRMRQSLRRNFYKSTIESFHGSSPKQWWQGIKKLLQINSVSLNADSLADSYTDGNVFELSNLINHSFHEVSSSMNPLTPSVEATNSIPSRYSISITDVQNKLSKIQSHKAIGPDGIPNWLLREFADLLAPPICAVFNSSLREGFVPSLWKSADVVPLPKKQPVTCLHNDLRPISLTPVLSKIMESFIVGWMREDVVHCQNQYGAIAGSSTTHALIDLLHQLLKGLDQQGSYARILLLDFSKGFDRIDHGVLIGKLSDNGVHPALVQWQRAFLTQRQQRVKIGQTKSSWLPVNGGVPQGTLSGPEDFLHMVDDMILPLPHIKYVDDTTIYEIESLDKQSKLQSAADEICDWATRNGMKLNPAKSKEIVIFFGKRCLNIDPIRINGQPIERVENAKLLGVHINNQLTWHTHIDNILRKANTRLYYLRELKRAGVQKGALNTVYTSLVRSTLEYASQAWAAGLTNDQVDQLEGIQKRAMHIIHPNLEYAAACKSTGIDSLQMRREKMMLKLFKEITHPHHKLNKLLPAKTEAQHQLRHSADYPLPTTRTKRFKNSFINWCIYQTRSVHNN